MARFHFLGVQVCGYTMSLLRSIRGKMRKSVVVGKEPYKPSRHKRCKVCRHPLRRRIETMWARGIRYSQICAEFEDINLRPNNISRHMAFSGLTRDPGFKLQYKLDEAVRKNLARIGPQMRPRDIIAVVRFIHELRG